MQLSNELKIKLNNAKTKEEAEMILTTAKKNIEAAGIILSDDELNKVAGGEEVQPVPFIVNPLT